MSAPMGPVTASLEKELTTELRQRGTVVWLDRDEHYTAYVDDLAKRAAAGTFPYPVVPFRGSHLEVMLALEPYGSNLDDAPLLVHLPKHNETSVRETPVLETYLAGFRFRKALDTLVREAATGKATPDEIAALLARDDLSLGAADEWLAAKMAENAGGLAGLLQQMDLPVLVTQLLDPEGRIQARARGAEGLVTLRTHLERHVGFTRAWETFYFGDAAPDIAHLAEALAGYLLCVEFVHDLGRPPALPALLDLTRLPTATARVCHEICQHLRDHQAELYAHVADEVATHLAGERDAIAPQDLGKIDTFWFEEKRVLEAAIQAVREGDYKQVVAWEQGRADGASFWLRRQPERRLTWSVLGDAARLGAAIAASPRPLQGARDHEDVVERYAKAGAAVDRAHRRFEQTWQANRGPQLPHLAELMDLVPLLRERHSAWVDDLARDFTRVCVDRGFLPEPSLRQRTLFDEVVAPLLSGPERVVYFVLDAFRYEMATELADELKGAGTTITLKARYAELPTITAVGMNVLAPVATGGRLAPVVDRGKWKGFRVGEFTVAAPDQRARAIEQKVGKVALLSLGEVCEGGLHAKTAAARIVVVHGREIDDAGEVGLGVRMFDGVLRDLKAAFHHLQLEGFKQFVFTADHGFLLQTDKPRERRYGRATDPDRRHVLADEARAEEGMTPVSLESLGYDGARGYLLFQEDTAVYRTPGAGQDFVHGGNSPEERIIPVLVVRRKSEAGTGTSTYAVEAKAERDLAGMRCLHARVRQAQSAMFTLGYAGARHVDVALRVPDDARATVSIKDVRGAELTRSGRIRAPIGEVWAEVYFTIEGARADKARVEVYHPDAIEQVRPDSPTELFTVDAPVGGAPVDAPDAAAPTTWLAGIPEEYRPVFAHLEAHGVVVEAELVRILGSARKARMFAIAFDGLKLRAPFEARVEPMGSGKRYVREGER